MTKSWSSVLFDSQIFWYPPRHSRVADLVKCDQYEPEATEYLKNILTPAMTFFDIGAHYGYYTLLAARRVQKVVAFEPRDKAVQVLKRNVDANSHSNVTIIPIPLFRKSTRGHMALSQFVEDPGGNLYARALDDLDCGAPDVIKIDVEGAECDVLMGASRTIERHRPEIIVECHSLGFLRIYQHDAKCLQDFFANVGYITEQIGKYRGEIFLRAGPK